MRHIVWLCCACCSCLLLLIGCSTSIRSYEVEDGQKRKGGVPYYLPKAAVFVREAVEVRREEKLFALIDFGGLQWMLYEIQDGDEFDHSLAELTRVLEMSRSAMMKLEPVMPRSIYLSELTNESRIKTAEHEGNESNTTIKYGLVPSGDLKIEAEKPFYPATNVDKAITVEWIPDRDREFELMIQPAPFASSEISFALSDGWRLDSISAKTGENVIVKELAATLRSVVEAQSGVAVAKIGAEQAIRLKQMELDSQNADGSGPENNREELVDSMERTVPVRLVGFVKRVELEAIMAGMYDLEAMMNQGPAGFGRLPTDTTVRWVRTSF